MLINRVGYPPIRKTIQFSANSGVFSDFMTNQPNDTFFKMPTSEKSLPNKSKLLYGAIAAIGILGIAFLVHKNIKPAKTKELVSPVIDELKSNYNKIVEKYPKDKIYYEKLAKSIGLKPGEEYKISSIVGEEQLTDLLKNFSQKDFEIGKNFEGIKNRTFRVNLHNHTTASDGKLAVNDFLEHSRKWADEVYSKIGYDGKPAFTVAITDHDTMSGAKEALSIVSKAPDKFKNLRLVLGSEISVSHINPKNVQEPFDFELIGYCLNPNNENLSSLLNGVTDRRVNFVKSMMEEINSQIPDLNLNWEEAKSFHPNIQRGTSNGAPWLIEEYAKFKMCMQKIISDLKKDEPDINIDISKIIKEYSKDYYYKMDTGKVGRGQVFNYFKNGFNISNHKISNFNEAELNFTKLENIKSIRKKYTANPVLLKESGIVLTPSDVFNANQLGGNEGFFGIAHPGFFNLAGRKWGKNVTDYCAKHPGNDEGLHFIWKLLKDLKVSGGKLFSAIEKNYQSYGKSDIQSWGDKIFDIAKNDEIDLLKTGGIDCHKTIFTKHEVLPDELITNLNIESIIR